MIRKIIKLSVCAKMGLFGYSHVNNWLSSLGSVAWPRSKMKTISSRFQSFKGWKLFTLWRAESVFLGQIELRALPVPQIPSDLVQNSQLGRDYVFTLFISHLLPWNCVSLLVFWMHEAAHMFSWCTALWCSEEAGWARELPHLCGW